MTGSVVFVVDWLLNTPERLMLVLLVCSFSLVRLSREGVNQGFRGGGESEVSSLWKGRNVGYLFCLGLGVVTSNITILGRRNGGRGLNSHASMG